MLTALVAVEGVGALAVAVLWLAAADFLGDSVVPRAFAALPLGFAVGTFAVVRSLVQRHRRRYIYAFLVQESYSWEP
jgi:hypothetical protein